jgi:hypothetical protein
MIAAMSIPIFIFAIGSPLLEGSVWHHQDHLPSIRLSLAERSQTQSTDPEVWGLQCSSIAAMSIPIFIFAIGSPLLQGSVWHHQDHLPSIRLSLVEQSQTQSTDPEAWGLQCSSSG